MIEARHWNKEADGRLHCGICPHGCRLAEGQRGVCGWREARGGLMRLPYYGMASSLCVDPIEKKPLYHFLPGTPILSLGTAGCNLQCRFCQNCSLSQDPAAFRRLTAASPEDIAEASIQNGCRSVAFTYNEPIIAFEYTLETARVCREHGLLTVAVTAGYIHGDARAEFFAGMDAANIDLKSFSDEFYRRQCGVRLAPVLETIAYVARLPSCFLELTTLLIPGLNDSPEELEELTRWVADQAGPDTPLHFSAFHPAHKAQELPSTPIATLHRARAIAQHNGLRYVYTGNVYDDEGSATICASCGQLLIGRSGFRVTEYNLDDKGCCPKCGAVCPGRFSP